MSSLRSTRWWCLRLSRVSSWRGLIVLLIGLACLVTLPLTTSSIWPALPWKSAAAKQDRIKKAKGLGSALQTKILQNLTIAKQGQGRLHLHRAAALLRRATEMLKTAHPDLKGAAQLKATAAGLEKDAAAAKAPADAERMRALAAILKEGGASRL